MSAFMVSKKHIDTLVQRASARHYGGDWAYYHDGERHEVPDRYAARTHLGQMLWDENARSVNERYDERDDAPVYAFAFADEVSAVQVLKAIDCYEYQACETDDWPSSQAHSFCDALRARVIHQLPGYDDAYWGVPYDDPNRAKTAAGERG